MPLVISCPGTLGEWRGWNWKGKKRRWKYARNHELLCPMPASDLANRREGKSIQVNEGFLIMETEFGSDSSPFPLQFRLCIIPAPQP